MRGPWLTALLLVGFGVSLGCEGRARREAAASLAETSPQFVTPANVYRFVGIEQSLSDARKALLEERWGDALAAAQALLKQEPGHLEAQQIIDRATLEAANATHFAAFQKALATRDTLNGANQFRHIGSDSVYFERGRPEYDKTRELWVTAREADARALVARGRCRDAHRVARSASDYFPELRVRLDAVANVCKPTAGQEAEPEPPTPAPIASAPVASLQAVAVGGPVSVPLPVEAKPEPPPAPAPAPAVPSPNPPGAPAAPAKPRMVAAFELESLRVAGDKHPGLTAGSHMIAHRDGVKQIAAAVGLCVSTAGAVENVELLKNTGFDDLNDKLLREVRVWRFRPYELGGEPVLVCTKVIFLWQID